MKIAVLFPGIGYHCDKPLLYYSGKLAAYYQYEITRVSYANLDKSIPKAFADAYAQTEKQLENIDWSQYEEILFLSKSIGTAVAAAYAQKHDISCRNVYYTPLPQTFDFAPQSGIVFHGTSDPWAETAVIEENCRNRSLPLYIVEHTNHSLELPPKDVSSPTPTKSGTRQNLHILETSMELTEQYIAHGIYYRTLCADEICPELFRGFVRRQKVVKCWRKESEKGDEKWVIRDDPFIDDWTEDDYRFLVKCLKNTVQTGGFVYAAFRRTDDLRGHNDIEKHDASRTHDTFSKHDTLCGQPSGSMLKGFISVEPTLSGDAQGYLDLSSLHVSEELRGKGIGSILFQAARDWAKKKGGKKLYISAHSAVETQAFYRAMGCVEAQIYNQRHVEQEPYDCQLEYTL